MPNLSLDIFFDNDIINVTASRAKETPRVKPAWKVRSAPKLPKIEGPDQKTRHFGAKPKAEPPASTSPQAASAKAAGKGGAPKASAPKTDAPKPAASKPAASKAAPKAEETPKDFEAAVSEGPKKKIPKLPPKNKASA